MVKKGRRYFIMKKFFRALWAAFEAFFAGEPYKEIQEEERNRQILNEAKFIKREHAPQ